MHLNKPSKELVLDLINEANGRSLTFVEVDIVNPQPYAGNRNTQATVFGREGTDYTGSKQLFYDRLDLEVAFPNNDPDGLELMVPNDGPTDVLEVCERLNRMFEYQIGLEDIVNTPVDYEALPAVVTVEAKPTSLAWYGQKTLTLVPDRPFWKDTFSSFQLDSFELPNGDVSGLTDPIATPNAVVSFHTTEDELLFDTGLPAGGFLSATNSELELALTARVDAGASVTAPDTDGSYNLPLLTESTWCLVYSVGLLDGGDLRDLYSTCIVLTRADTTSCTLKLIEHEGGLAWHCDDMDLTVPVDYISVDGDVIQGRIDAGAIRDALLPAGNSGGGAPMGLFTFRLQARRQNSIAPRVMSTILVKAYNN